MHEPFARHTDPDTSKDVHVNVEQLRGLIMAVLRKHFLSGLATCQITRELGVHEWSISPRMKPMEEDRLIIRLPKRKVENSSGNKSFMTIWAIHPRLLCGSEVMPMDRDES